MDRIRGPKWDKEDASDRRPISVADRVAIAAYYRAETERGRTAEEVLEDLSERYSRSTRQIQRHVRRVDERLKGQTGISSEAQRSGVPIHAEEPGSLETPAGSSQPPAGGLDSLKLAASGTMHGPGWPSSSPDTRYWVLRVRLENLSDKPVSFEEICLHITRAVPEDNEIHSWPHMGRDTYGSHGGVPLADQALPTLITLTPESPVL